MTADPLNIPPVEVPQILTRPIVNDARSASAAAVAATQPFRSEVTFAEPGAAGFTQEATNFIPEDEGIHSSMKRRTNKVNVASRRIFVEICNPMSAAFAEVIIIPSLQFTDRTLESNYQRTYFTSLRRITYTVLVGWGLNSLQLWFGLYKGWLGINASRENVFSSSTTTPPSAFVQKLKAVNQFHTDDYNQDMTKLTSRADSLRWPDHYSVDENGGSLVDWQLLSSFPPEVFEKQDYGSPDRRLLASIAEPTLTPKFHPTTSSARRSGDGQPSRRPDHPGVEKSLKDMQVTRMLWGKEEITDALRPNANLFEAACINQTVADSILLFFWWLFSSLKRYYRRLEAITICVQITRVLLIVLFAQGMWSDCARNQGPTDIMMNNIAIASANVTYFNSVPICRVRRGCVVTGIFAVGVLEIIIVMTQGTTGGVAMSPHDAAQLTMYILIFVCTPIVALVCRFRAEVCERESYYLSLLYDQTSAINAALQAELDDLNKVRDLNIEQSLPEGLLPSKIVHVAVRELQQAVRGAEHLQKSLPSIFWQQTKSSQRRNMDLATQRLSTARRVTEAVEVAEELKESISSALKLLCRSHDIYTPPIQGNYAGAMLFHAVGHAVRPGRDDLGALSQEGDETTEGLGDAPPSLLSRNTAKRMDGAPPPTATDFAGPLDRQNSQTVGRFGASYNENAIGDSTNNCSPRIGDSAAGDDVTGVNEIIPLVFGSADFPLLSGLGEMARNIGSNWHFDMLKVTRVTKDESILTTGILLASSIAEGIQFDWKRWFTFLKNIQNEYGASDAIPYHNRTHSSIHAHTCAVLLEWLKHSEHSTKLESLGILVSSLCHDVGHPGRTNAYLVNANKRLAIVYNDISVLENYHSCRTFEILMQKQSNFISSIGLEDYRYFRKVIIELILATDMKQHFELLNNYKLQRNTPSFNMWSQENKLSTLKLVMKAADLSHGAFDWNTHNILSMNVNEEFWAQGDAELAMGLPVSPLCDRNISKEKLASTQASFLEFLVLPLYKELEAVESAGIMKSNCESRILSNIDKWKNMANSADQDQQQPAAQQPPKEVALVRSGERSEARSEASAEKSTQQQSALLPR